MKTAVYPANPPPWLPLIINGHRAPSVDLARLENMESAPLETLDADRVSVLPVLVVYGNRKGLRDDDDGAQTCFRTDNC